ncbi:MAG TPA: transglutaminase domain-containing protein [Chitinophagaceae bacterium]|nr:transglutaminase domain-containing protein [Chitinophagaceae bacterium]
MRKLLLSATIVILILNCQAQDKPPVKFGKISAEDFKTSVYSIDSNAAAVVMADIGSSSITGNSKGWFSIDFKHFKRIHILKKSAYELADVQIPLYTDGHNEEEVQNLKAYTYNIENGKVVETKLDTKSGVFQDKLSKNHLVKKFTFPAIKEGSIIEYEYTLRSDFIFNLQPWEFQGAYPRLWSEYNVSIPEFLYYVFLLQGVQYDYSRTTKDRHENFRVVDGSGVGASETFTFDASVTDYRMVMKNIPALKAESFTSTIDNHVAKIDFQLAEYRQPLTPRNIMGTWTDVTKDLLKDEEFGLQLSRDNAWLSDELGIAMHGAKSDLDKAKNIYQYLQDNFTCTSYSRLYTDQPLKNILKAKKGSEAEINLLLVAMLRKAGFSADPLMLSTKSHGYVLSVYPIMDKFNYVACRTTIGNKIIYLDASRPRLGFGSLDWECYNGHARVINQEATPVELSSDSLNNTKITSLMFFSDEKGEILGKMQQVPGYYESYSLRNRIKEKGADELFKDIKKDFGADVNLSNLRIDSIEKYDQVLQLNYDVVLNLEKDDIIYLNPMFGEGYKENPFKSVTRTYPVEMPYTFDEMYVFRIEVPLGYEVDELPKSTKVLFDEEGRSFFEYIIQNSNGVISFRSRVKLARSYYLPEEYEILREFFNLIVSKHNEQIVFKKKK